MSKALFSAILAVVVVTVFTSTASARALTSEDIARNVTAPFCFTRAYTRAHLEQHPRQTVKAMKATLAVIADSGTDPVPVLEIAVEFKNEPGRLYRQSMSCMDYRGRVHCRVDCDGGSMEIYELGEDRIKIRNNGVTVNGGCDGEERSRFIATVRGGDDAFFLGRAQDGACWDVPDRRNNGWR